MEAELALQEDEEATSIQHLPNEILVQILSSIREASDLSACLSTCKSLQVLAIDPVLGATWLLNRHRDQPRLTLLKAAQQGNGAVMSQLLKMGVSATECSPLQLAISHDLYEVADYLWNTGPHEKAVRACVKDAANALSHAAESGKAEFVQLLLRPPSPLNGNTQDSADYYPLHRAGIAASKNGPEVVRLLLAAGASATACNQCGENALMLVCLLGDCDVTRAAIVKTILESLDEEDRVRVTVAQDFAGDTALHRAVRFGLAECCSEILQSGSQALSICNDQNHTPNDLARMWGRVNVKVLEVFERHGTELHDGITPSDLTLS